MTRSPGGRASVVAVRIFVVVLLLALLGACSSDEQSAPTPDPLPSTTPGTSPDAASSETCQEVRAGIDAFNLADYTETVARFRAAVPLAEAADDGTAATAALLAAVRYYAELDPADYPESSRSSADFEKYKQITLGQCASPDGTVTPQEPGIEA